MDRGSISLHPLGLPGIAGQAPTAPMGGGCALTCGRGLLLGFEEGRM
ncbi:hypothetical protein AAD018_018180 [Aestuariibius insulae]